LAHFYSSGHDRRGGAFDLASSPATSPYGAGTQTYDTYTQFLPFTSRVRAIDPFQYLIGVYGTGNNGYDALGTCSFLDFVAYAARLDYAVAANLNIFGSIMYAERASNTGTPVAMYDGAPGFGRYATVGSPNVPAAKGTGSLSDVSTALSRLEAVLPYTASGAAIPPTGANSVVPNVPDNYLGWELDAGFDWKLLEGLTMKGLFAYWQPGDWFKWAYVDHSDTTPITLGDQTGVPLYVNPNRTIDPIIGFKGSMVMEF
jgi:hypothetical protein